MHALCNANHRPYFAHACPHAKQARDLTLCIHTPCNAGLAPTLNTHPQTACKATQQQPTIAHAHPVQGQPCSPLANTHPCAMPPVSPRCTPSTRHVHVLTLPAPPLPPLAIPGSRAHTHVCTCARARPGVGRGRGQSRRRACPSPAAARPRRAAGTQTSRDRGAPGPALTTCSPPPTGVRYRPSHSPSGAAEDCNSQRAPRGGATPPSP